MQKRSVRSGWALWVPGILLALGAAVAVLQLTHTTHFFGHAKPPVSASANTKGEVSATNPASSPTNSTSGPSSVSQDKTGNGSTATTAPLVAPSGNFVSNHHPNLSGNPAPNLIASSCTTTPGATCQISFTKDGVTKSLPSETVDVGGSAFWNWKLQAYGVTEGSWTVQATAKLDSQTKTTTDVQNLVVNP